MKKTFHKRRLVRIFLFGTLLFALLGGYAVGAFARYRSSVWSADRARVAKFDVSAVCTLEATDLEFALSSESPTASYPFSVTSESEVALSYDVVVTLPSPLPSYISLTIPSADGETLTPTSSDGLRYTFSNVGSFTASGGTNTHTLTVCAANFDNDVSLSDVQVQVVATQTAPQ